MINWKFSKLMFWAGCENCQWKTTDRVTGCRMECQVDGLTSYREGPAGPAAILRPSVVRTDQLQRRSSGHTRRPQRLDDEWWSIADCEARFPLPELTARVDGWPVSITRQHVHGPSTRLVETRARQHGPCWRVMEIGHPSTRAVNSGRQLG